MFEKREKINRGQSRRNKRVKVESKRTECEERGQVCRERERERKREGANKRKKQKR